MKRRGIYVRAKGCDERIGSYDIAELDRDSLLRFLRSRGGDNEWAENVVLVLLGHTQNEGPFWKMEGVTHGG